MFCPKCGNELKPGAKFCAKCGAPQEPPSAPGPVNQGNGGHPVAEKGNGNRQPGQGAANPGPIQPNPGPQPEKPRKKTGKGPLVAVLILLILACLGAGGFAAYKLGVLDSLLDLTSKQTSTDEDDRGSSRKKSGDDEEPDDEDGEEDSDEDDSDEADEEETAGEEREPEETSPEETTEAEKIKLSELLNEAETTTPAAETSSEEAADPPPANEGMLPVPAETSAAAESGDYVIPDSSVRRISAADLEGLTKDQLKIARNEIYARHGRKFDSEVLQFYFNSKSWYEGTIEPSAFSEDLLSQVEKDNIKLIKAKEESMP